MKYSDAFRKSRHRGCFPAMLEPLALPYRYQRRYRRAAHNGSPQALRASLAMPSESLWRTAAFEMQSPLTTSFNFSPSSGASVPSSMMIGYAALYTAVFLAVAVRQLSKRDL
jgi:hypothetical protein